MSIPEAASVIRTGRLLCIAGEESQLKKLPAGNWIGGTIPYFMNEDGGTTDRERVFVCELPTGDAPADIRLYDVESLPRVCADGPANGYTLVIIPAFSEAHMRYAREAPDFEDMFVRPIVGWIAGVHLDELEVARPAVFDGSTGRLERECAVALHIPLPDDRYAHIDIINGMRQGDGDRIRFPKTDFSASDCLVNGTPTNLATYLDTQDNDPGLPLVANYCGAQVNVSIRGVNRKAREVEFYAPVFDDVEYRLAAPAASIEEGLIAADNARFSCNCVLNYVHEGLEGRRTGHLTGPMTFGEIAYLLLNQTLVYLSVEEV
ncbi:DUF6976 family protein [Alkalilimnicola ehrlichii]|nr:hypothetical protein [Alkalilimnicola ehrlichii]